MWTKWMFNLDGTRRINRLTIPGTHDSGSMFYIPGHDYDQCQDKLYREQLDMGARFLDIRLVYVKSAKGGINFAVHHKHDYQWSYFDEDSDYSNNPDCTNFVLQPCIEFLKENPSECIIMTFKQEEPKVDYKTFEDGFRALLQKDGRESAYCWVENRVPALEEARGRIILVNRLDDPETPPNPNFPDYRPSYGILWPDWDATRGGVFPQPMIDVDDHYMDTTTRAKWRNVKDHFDKATGKVSGNGPYDANYWYITFVSCAPGNASPSSWAKTMNPLVLGYLQDPANAPSANERLGTVLMDYPPQELMDKIIWYALIAYPAPDSVRQLNGSKWASPIDAAVFKPISISADSYDTPYIIDYTQGIRYYDGVNWPPLPGQNATDISVSPDGDVWIIGAQHSDAYPGDYRIYKWDWTGAWKEFPSGAATRISAGSGGKLGVVNHQGGVWFYDGNQWAELPGQKATDIGVSPGPNPSIWIIGAQPSPIDPSNFPIYKWDWKGEWKELPKGQATHITVGNDDQVYVVNYQQDVWHYDGSGGNFDGKNWTKLPGVRAADIGESNGKVWVLGWKN